MADQVLDLRNIVLTMLTDTLEDGVFSNVCINDVSARYELSLHERAFISRLYLGVLERLIFIDHIINKHSSVQTAKMKPVIRGILRMSVYQLLFMDSVPDHAALSEAVRLVKKRKIGQLSGFVNGVLRSIQREADKDIAAMPENVRLSVPGWIYEMLISDLGKDKAVRFLEGTLDSDRGVTIRLNTLKGSVEDIAAALAEEGCILTPVDEEAACFRMKSPAAVNKLEGFAKGLFSVQDVSSVRAALAGCSYVSRDCDGRPLILDVCAAPGGKSICAAQYFPEGRVVSGDISEKKTALIEENRIRLGINNIETLVHDAREPLDGFAGRCDLVIADLPCSGIGVTGGKPDIKFRLRKQDIDSLAQLQRSILKASSGYAKEDGILVYSTCTVDKKENADNAAWFSEHFPYKLLMEEQITDPGQDGFYIAVFKKIKTDE